jgi:hypothetical protein
MNALLQQFADDPDVRLLAGLVALDVLLGVLAALVTRTFRFVLVADFLRADVLAKLVPYFGVWAAVHVTGDVRLGEFGIIEETVGALAIAAVGASILKSLGELGLSKFVSLPKALASADPTTPTVEPPPPTS